MLILKSDGSDDEMFKQAARSASFGERNFLFEQVVNNGLVSAEVAALALMDVAYNFPKVAELIHETNPPVNVMYEIILEVVTRAVDAAFTTRMHLFFAELNKLNELERDLELTTKIQALAKREVMHLVTTQAVTTPARVASALNSGKLVDFSEKLRFGLTPLSEYLGDKEAMGENKEEGDATS